MAIEDNYPDHGSWECTPVWHPRFWLGYQMRRWRWDGYSIGDIYDGIWEYASYRRCALQALEQIATGPHGG